MYEETERYYRNSGRVPFGGILMMQVAAVLAAAVGGAAYAAIERWNPFIYFTFLATCAFGLATGFAVRVAAQKGKVRSRMFTGLLGTAAGVLAVYFAWAFYSLFIFDFQAMLWNPLHLWQLVLYIMDNPVWTMRGSEPAAWMLAILWLLEAGIIVGISATTALADDKPFCDPCDSWTEATVSSAILPLTDPEALRRDLEAEKYGVLDDLMAEPASPTNCYQATIHSCPQCEESNFLTVSHVTITPDNEGNLQTKVEPLIKSLRIPFLLAEHLKVATNPVVEEVTVSESEDQPTDDPAVVAEAEDGPSELR